MFGLVLFAQQSEKIEIPKDTTIIDIMTKMIITFGIIAIVIVALMATTRICIDLLFKTLRRWLNERRVEREIEQVKPTDIVKKILLTDSEKVFFKILVKALPEFYVFAQVALGAILQNKTQFRNRGKFSQKIADFAIVNKDLDIIAIIELDDKSHHMRKKKEKDIERDIMLKNAGYLTIRYDCRNMPNTETIRQDIKV